MSKFIISTFGVGATCKGLSRIITGAGVFEEALTREVSTNDGKTKIALASAIAIQNSRERSK